jgi:hypothetical protein
VILAEDAVDGGAGYQAGHRQLAQALTVLPVAADGGSIKDLGTPPDMLSFELGAPHAGAHSLDDQTAFQLSADRSAEREIRLHLSDCLRPRLKSESDTFAALPHERKSPAVAASQRKYKGTFVPHSWEIPGIAHLVPDASTSQYGSQRLSGNCLKRRSRTAIAPLRHTTHTAKSQTTTAYSNRMEESSH